jgi:secreted trypsin-like serine protease
MARPRSTALTALFLATGLAAIGFASTSARAVVGGEAETGALAAYSLMVLNSRGGVCTGVVIARDVVATAAHCVAGNDEHRAHFRKANGAPVLLEIAALALHPEYDASAIQTRRRSIDLALLRLAEPLPAHFAPAALASATVPEGAVVRLAGYGTSDESDKSGRTMGTLRAVDLAVIEPHGPSRILLWLSDPAKSGRGGCQGDSGGPIAVADAVVALSTWTRGAEGRACGEISQGVRLGPQRAWIDQTLAGWGRAAQWR